VAQPPRSAFQVKRFPEAGFTLHRDHLLFNHKLLGVWLLELDDDRHFDRGVYRDLRVCLSRIHAERECLKETLRLLARPESKNVLALESAAFQKYLIRAAGILLKKQFYGFDRSEVLEAAQEFDVMLIPGERETIVSELQNLSSPPTTMNALMELVNPAKQPDSVREVTNNYYISRAREIAMGDINKSNEQSGGSKTITITGSQNVNVESTLTNVQMSVGAIAAASDADKKQLQDLLKQLNDALKQVPAEKAEQAEAVATQASQLVETAAKDKPNKTMLQVVGNGLRQTADFLKDAIPSAVTIAGQIVSLIGKIHGIPI
jgi:hypothetical protein